MNNDIKKFEDMVGKTLTSVERMQLGGFDDTGFLKLGVF